MSKRFNKIAGSAYQCGVNRVGEQFVNNGRKVDPLQMASNRQLKRMMQKGDKHGKK